MTWFPLLVCFLFSGGFFFCLFIFFVAKDKTQRKMNERKQNAEKMSVDYVGTLKTTSVFFFSS
jgi:hypothetical protein